jgi:hypothetical protein
MRSFFSKKYIYVLSGFLLVTLGLSLIFLVLPRSGVAQNSTVVVSILNLIDNQTLSHNYTFEFESTSNLDFVEINFIRLDNNNLADKRAVAQRINTTSNIWSYTLDLSLLGNGLYRLETVAVFLDGTEVAGQTRNFNIIQSAIVLDQINIVSPANQTVVAGDIVLQAESSKPVTEMIFSIYNSLGILEKQIASSVSTIQTVHTVHLDSKILGGDGTYTLQAQADLGDNVINAEPINFYIVNNYNQNATSTTPQSSTSTIINLTFTSPIRNTEISGKYLIQVSSNVEVDKLYFRFGGNLVAARKYDKNLWQEYVVTTNYPNGEYQLLAVASYQGQEYYSPVISVRVVNTTTTIDVPITPPVAEKNYPVAPILFIPSKLKDSQVINKATSSQPQSVNIDKLTIASTTAPVLGGELIECANQNIQNITCQVYLKNSENFSDACAAKVLDIQNCINSLEKCKNSGIINVDNCFFYLSEPRASRWCDLTEFRNESLCIEYNSQRLPAQQSSNLDKRCLDQGLATSEICQRFLEFINLPQECQNQKIINQDECRNFLRSNFLSTACQVNGLQNSTDCEQELLTKYQNQETCQGSECQNLVKDYLSELAARDVSKQVLVAAKLKIANGYLDQTNKTDSDIKPLLARLPVKFDSDENYKIFTAQDQIGFVDKQLVSSLPLVLVKDTDHDGLPDDMERRLGTIINNPDTDNDGFTDGEEVRNSYDPLLPRVKLNKILAPVEIALMNDVTFEHASLAGSETPELQVADVINSSDSQENNLILNGVGPAFSVVTLYLYSDIPLVATVQVDEYGRWQYTLTDKMVDGQHEVYVAINDETGKVAKKSIGKIFFINQARAATVNDYINLTISEEPSILEKYYLPGVITLVLLSVIIFLFILRRRRATRNIFPS